MTSRFNYVVCSIKDSNNVSTLIVDEHQRMKWYKENYTNAGRTGIEE